MKRLARIFENKFVRIFFTFASLVGLYFFLTSSFFDVKSVRCKTQYGPCSKTDEGFLAKYYSGNLFFTNTGKVETELEGLFINRQVYVERIFPNSLSVSIEKRKAIVALKTNGRKEVYLADRDGRVIDFVPESYLPTLEVGSQELVVGESLDEKLQTALKLLYLTFKSQTVKAGQVQEDKLVVKVQEIEVYLPLTKDPQVTVGALQLILARSRIEDKLPKLIDLRYSKPVLTYGQDQSVSGN